MTKEERVAWVVSELKYRNLPNKKGMEIFKKEFGTKGKKYWSDSVIQDFPELQKFKNVMKDTSTIREPVKLDDRTIIRRMFKRLTKNEKNKLSKTEPDTITEAFKEFVAVSRK